VKPNNARIARRSIALACALLLAACGGGGGSSGNGNPAPPDPAPPPADPQVRVTGGSPFPAGCDGVAVSGTLYRGAEVEPMIAANPRNPDNLVGVWQQDRWSNGSAQGLMSGVSFDGGRTWERHAAPFTRCTGGNAANGGDYARGTDPWVSFGPDGVAWQIALASNGAAFAPGSSNAVLASRSFDGGRTWSDPVTLIRDADTFFNDKESITADPLDPRYVYATWDRLRDQGTGPTWFARTTNGGQSWEPARGIFDPGPASQTINNQIVVLPDGTLVDFFTWFDAATNNLMQGKLAVIRSIDKGLTWSAPTVIAVAQPVGASDPETRAAIRDGANLGSIAAGPRGELVAVWQDGRFSGGARDGIAFSRSPDGGRTWSAPAAINGDATVAAFLPSVSVRSDGTIGVTYYDLRRNTPDPSTLPTDYWLARSSDGVTWRESHVAGPFNLAVAPNAGGLFLGDYQALTSIGNTFVPFYVQTNDGDTGNRTDVFATLAGLVSNATQAKSTPASAPGEPVLRAATAEPLPSTPELQQRLHESIVRTMQRRVPGWRPPG
jgi:hypothetical protein